MGWLWVVGISGLVFSSIIIIISTFSSSSSSTV